MVREISGENHPRPPHAGLPRERSDPGSGGHQNKAHHSGSTPPLEEGVYIPGMGLPGPEIVMETTPACFLQKGLRLESYLISHFVSISCGFNTGDKSREPHAQGSKRMEEKLRGGRV